MARGIEWNCLDIPQKSGVYSGARDREGWNEAVAVAFAMKLRMAAAALGCDSRKEFCARFRAVNPATQCDLDRLNKWIQGRSLPRASSIYTDFAAVIGTPKSGHWIAECSRDEFAAELAGRTGFDPNVMAVPDALPRRGNPRTVGLIGGLAAFTGTFAGYSQAWSPHFAGRLVRASLQLALGRTGVLSATYTEAIIGRDVRLTGEVWIGGRSMSFVAREQEGEVPLFFSLHSPGLPASVLCGVMSGLAFVANETLPSACRVVFIRVSETPMLNLTNRYLTSAPGAIAADLLALGVSIPDTDKLDGFARDFVGERPDQVTLHDQTLFASMLDRQFLQFNDGSPSV